MSQTIDTFVTSVGNAFNEVTSSLENLSGDVQNLNKQIQDLQAQLGNLSPEDQAKLDSVVTSASALASRAKTLADQTPDLPPAPTA